MSSIAPLDLAAPLLDWADRRGEPLDPRAAEAVLGLLALSGARRRTGLPEPAPELVEDLMLTLLPLHVSAGPAELAGFPAVLVALIGYTREAGKLNARRRDRLVAAVEALKPQFAEAMTSPHRATWARLYGQLLRADEVAFVDLPELLQPGWIEAVLLAHVLRRRLERLRRLFHAPGDSPLTSAPGRRFAPGTRPGCGRPRPSLPGAANTAAYCLLSPQSTVARLEAVHPDATS